MSDHNIKNITFFEADSPLSQPIADATHSISSIRFLITRIELNSGILGESYLLAFHYSPKAIRGALKDLAPLALEFEVFDTKRFIAQANQEAEYFGNEGLNRWAQGALEIAMWDAWTKSLKQPIWKVLGAKSRSVPVYGSGGWLSYSMDELISEVTHYKQRGFRAVKIKVGSPAVEMDIERLTKVREAVGPQLNIMMDANQGMNYPSACKLVNAVADLGIHWFEEPLPHTDFDGYAQLRKTCPIALAMGEREYNTVALRELAQRNALDLWQPDILRLGGVDGWQQSAALALSFNIPILPHYYKEYDVPLLCTVNGAYGTESFDWVDGLLDEPVRIHEGIAYPSERPGWGFEFKDEYLSEI